MVNLKVKVNDNEYVIEIENENVLVNNTMMKLKIQDNKISLDDKIFYLDFVEEGEPSLFIVNGSSYIVTKDFSEFVIKKEIQSPINGKITNLLVNINEPVKKNQTILVIEAMKMENQIKSQIDGVIKIIWVKKNQLVKKGEKLVTFL